MVADFSPRFASRNVSIRQFIAALRDNSYKQATGHLVRGGAGTTVTACAIGQAALNLGVDENDLQAKLDQLGVKFGIGYEKRALTSKVINMNDGEKRSCQYIADWLETHTSEAQKDLSIKVSRKLWSKIIGDQHRGVTVPRGAVRARSMN